MDTKEHRRWLLNLMAQHGLNEKQWAEKAELSTPNILYNYLKGRAKSISEASREKLAPFIGLTADQMRKGKALHDKGLKQTQSHHNPAMESSYHSPIGNDDGDMPVYGPVGASSLAEVRITEENIMDWKPKPDYLKNVKGAYWMYVDGNSMSPRYDHGDLVAVHPRLPPLPNKDCVIFDEENETAKLKRYLGETDTEWKFKQFNPEETFKIKKRSSIRLCAVKGRRDP